MTPSVSRQSTCTRLATFPNNQFMDKNYTIRAMSQDDLTSVGELDALSFAEPWPMHSFAYELTTDYSICLVAVDLEEKVLGAIVVWVIVDEAHIATIAVNPNHLKRGIGSCLLAQALLVAAGRGAVSSMLEVPRLNLPALALYRRFGYHRVGIRRNYYKNDNEDALLLNLESINIEVLRNFFKTNCV